MVVRRRYILRSLVVIQLMMILIFMLILPDVFVDVRSMDELATLLENQRQLGFAVNKLVLLLALQLCFGALNLWFLSLMLKREHYTQDPLPRYYTEP